jgi:hypothetical protein
MATGCPDSPCKGGLEEEKFQKAIEALKEAHEHSTNSARIWEELSKPDKIGQHFPADGKLQSNRKFRDAIVSWHNDRKQKSKAQYTSILMSAFPSTKKPNHLNQN